MLPEFVKGDNRFGLADLRAVNKVAQNEFKSKDKRYQKRHTYAMRIGYNGIVISCFHKNYATSHLAYLNLFYYIV